MTIYTDVEGKEFKITLWCHVFDRKCEDITKEEQKNTCHGCCSSCMASEQR